MVCYKLYVVVSRVHEAIVHYGEGIKDIINEELGDGM